MNIALIILAVFVLVVMAVGNIAETHAHKSPKTTDDLEDLRLAYAPDLMQAIKNGTQYAKQEPWDRYYRELEDAKIKRWLEGNPVTDEHPLIAKEAPIPPSRYIPFL